MKKKNKIMRAAAVSAVLAFGITFGGCAAGCGRFIGGQASPSSAGTESGSTAGNPSTPSGSDNTKKHSSIVDELMTNKYYLDLSYKVFKNGCFLSKEMLPIPYQYLREEGKDVDAYLDGTLNAFASSYMYNDDKNHLYVSVKAENKSYSEYGNYYTNYVLKYPLTNQESEEYLLLCKNEYVQGLLFIQELDIQKKDTRTVLSEVNIAKDTYETMLDYITYGENVNPNKYNSVEVDFLNSDMEKINVTVRGSKYLNCSQTTIRNLTITDFTFWVNPQTYDNNVLWYGVPTAGDISFDDYLSSTKNITSFGYGQQIENYLPFMSDYELQPYH